MYFYLLKLCVEVLILNQAYTGENSMTPLLAPPITNYKLGIRKFLLEVTTMYVCICSHLMESRLKEDTFTHPADRIGGSLSIFETIHE